MTSKWKKDDSKMLRRLRKQGLYYKQIAQRMGYSHSNIIYHAKKLGLQGRLAGHGKWNTKYSHKLVKDIFIYFQTHTWAETGKQFNLTDGELKSVFTNGYKDRRLKKYRKDCRTKRLFGADDYLFILRRAGLLPHAEIATALKRTKKNRRHVIHERLMELHCKSRYISGLTEQKALALFPDKAFECVTTKSGSPGRQSAYTKILPWVACEDLLSAKEKCGYIGEAITALAKYQRWLYSAKTNRECLNSIYYVLGIKKSCPRKINCSNFDNELQKTSAILAKTLCKKLLSRTNYTQKADCRDIIRTASQIAEVVICTL